VITPALLSSLINEAARPSFEFAYIDESGDTGKNGSRTYTLGCVLIPGDSWTPRLDIITTMRREIRDVYGIPVRAEIKANSLIRPRGDLKDSNLGDGQRRDIYQRHFHTLSLVSSGVFAVVIDKEKVTSAHDYAQVAWDYLYQRLRNRSERFGHPILVIHDEGDADRVRKTHRKFRRHSFNASGQRVAAPLLVEDPVARQSHQSYFIQMADLVAFSAFRAVQPPAKPSSVCGPEMWEQLASLQRAEVTTARRDGIIVWPT
jgi:hypothetical protein